MADNSFQLPEVLTFATVPAQSKMFSKLLQKSGDATNITVDFAAVKNCDSAGLAFLIKAKRQCLHLDKQLVIENISQDVTMLANFCGVDGLLA